MEQLFYALPALESIRDFLELGGPVVTLIGLLMLVMWLLILERLFFLRSRHPRNVKAALDIWEGRPERKSWTAHQVRSRLVSVVSTALERNLGLIKVCVALCPLLGLLGTVTGMIQVFEVMSLTGSSNVRAMADGVSKSTVPTMAGMVAAVTGLIMSAWLANLARRERKLLTEHMTTDH